MPSELDESVRAALADLSEGLYPSVRAAAAAYSLDFKTLHNRLNYGLIKRESHGKQQSLALEQEELLV